MLIITPQNLADFTNTLRKQKKLSQSQVGATVGLKQTTISKFELRPESTQLDTLFRILSALDLEIHIKPKPKSNTPDNNQKWHEEW